jgi:hypothetical protein
MILRNAHTSRFWSLGSTLKSQNSLPCKRLINLLRKRKKLHCLLMPFSAFSGDARWLLVSRLATGYGFRFVPLEIVDELADELQLKPGQIPKAKQLAEFRHRLGADLVVSASLLDYGKVRWQWLLTGMLVDMTVDNTIIGLATGWNPIALAASVGWDVLTSAPIWFGGGYLFGVAFRPVRVEARAFETLQGYPIWQTMEEAVYASGALKTLPKEIRGRKEVQLELNLAEILESMGDSLTAQNLSRSSCCQGTVR